MSRTIAVTAVLLVGLIALGGCLGGVVEPLTDSEAEAEEIDDPAAENLSEANESVANETNESDAGGENASASVSSVEDNESDAGLNESSVENESEGGGDDVATDGGNETDADEGASENETGEESPDGEEESASSEDESGDESTETESDSEGGDETESDDSEGVSMESQSTNETDTETESESTDQTDTNGSDGGDGAEEEESESFLTVEVLDAGTEEPIGDARVAGNAQGSNADTPLLNGSAGSEGVIHFMEPSGTYELKVTASGYASEDIVVEHDGENESHQYVHLEPTESGEGGNESDGESEQVELVIEVSDTETGEPIEGASVGGELMGGGGDGGLQGTTDANGDVTFEIDEAGMIEFSVEAEGYQSGQLRIQNVDDGTMTRFVELEPVESESGEDAENATVEESDGEANESESGSVDGNESA